MTDEVRWLSQSEQRSWRNYLRASRLLESALDAALVEHGVQLTEYEIISMLSEAPGQRRRMSELATRVVQSRSRLTHTAGRLEKRGWVTREPCLDDKRGVEIVLTDAGREAVLQMSEEHVKSVRSCLVDVMSPEQFQALGEAMGLVCEHLDPDHQTDRVP